MKVLFVVTGRGLGGDSAIAINISKALSKNKVECEFALNHGSPGILYKKNGLKWYEISIPQAGGHAATKTSLLKGALKTFRAIFEARSLYKKVKPDVVVGVLGGGAIVGCLAAKLAGIPSVGVICTPSDSQLVKFTSTVAIPESPLFTEDIDNPHFHKCFNPINPDIIEGDKEKAIGLMPPEFNPELPTILLSSGSTLFEKMALAAPKLRDNKIKANIVVIGDPLDEKYREYLETPGIIYLGFISWVKDLYKLADFVIITDDGMMLHEAIACNLPIITLLRVKYGRYHNMSKIFGDAMVESELDELPQTVNEFLNNLDKIKITASKYGEEVLQSADNIAKIIIDEAK